MGDQAQDQEAVPANENTADAVNVQRRQSVGIKPPGWAVATGETTGATTPTKKASAQTSFNAESRNAKKSTARKARQRRKTDSEAFLPPKLAELEETDEFDLGGLSILSISERHLGSREFREARKADLLKRRKPESKLFGYAKTFVESETKRLALGIKEQHAAHEAFLQECETYETTIQRTLASAKMTVTRIRNEVISLETRIEERDCDLGALRQSESELKAKLETASKTVEDAQKAEADLKAQNADLLASKTEMEGTIVALKQREVVQNDLVAKLEKELEESKERREKVQESLDSAISERDRMVADLNKRFADAKEEWKVDEQAANQKYRDLVHKLEAAEKITEEMRETIRKAEERAKTAEEDLLRSNVGAEGLKAQLNNLDEQAKQKDAHLHKTLETFQENQRFSQERIASMSEEKTKLEHRVNELAIVKGELEVNAAKLEGSLKEANEANATLTSKVAALEEKAEAGASRALELEVASKSAEDRIEKATREVAALTVETVKLKNAVEQGKSTHASAMEAADAERVALKGEVAELTKRNAELEGEVAVLKEACNDGSNNDQLERLCEVSKEAERLKRQVHIQKDTEHEIAMLRQKLQETEAKLFEADKAKRDLHNEVQALKGKVRVVARIRPVSTEREEAKEGDSASSPTELPSFLSCSVDGQALALETEKELSQGKDKKTHKFNFDRVFAPGSEQEQVFEEVSSFVQSALDGYNVCLFSYGQTGSGKTYTMTGELQSQEGRGIIPRSIDQIMAYQTELRAKGWEYTLEATYVEIYNENICDLLCSPNSKEGVKLEIRDSKKDILVTNTTRLPIESKEDITKVLKIADTNRSVAATDSNAQSSRSHSVFTLFIKGAQKEFGAEVTGSLSMCDLAGSERLSRSGAAGDRLKEAQSINKSLSALANVFSALQNKAGHIPYRNSKLTHMLQPCFAGEGKTMMIVNLSPELADRNESLCSLRFAGQVSKTELGRAKKNIAAIPAPP